MLRTLVNDRQKSTYLLARFINVVRHWGFILVAKIAPPRAVYVLEVYGERLLLFLLCFILNTSSTANRDEAIV
jgi:hypothetical protein